MTSTRTYFFVGLICLFAGLFIGYSFDYVVKTKHAAPGHSMTMGDTMASMTADLQDKTGDEFNKAFIENMVVHHQGAIEMSKLVFMKASTRPELVKLANEIVAAQTREINQMNAWRDLWFKASAVKPPQNPAPVACTMEAKICPDGSAVGRQGPNCEFALCPGN